MKIRLNEVDFSGFDDNDLGGDWVLSKEYIKGATLLTLEEYKQLKDSIPKLEDDCWWLRSKGVWNTQRDNWKRHIGAYFVDDHTGRVSPLNSIYTDDVCIRPVLILDVPSCNLKLGDSFEFGERTFVVISDEYAICEDYLCRSAFRKTWNLKRDDIYTGSIVKEIVDKWFAWAYEHYGE